MRKIKLSHKKILENNNELITAASLGPSEDILIIGDEAGNIRVIRFVPCPTIEILHHFNAHRNGISSVSLFTTEETNITMLMTISVSRNIKLFTERGNFLGYFGQNRSWNVKSSAVPCKQPKYSQVYHKGGTMRDPKKFKDSVVNEGFKLKQRVDGNKYDSVSNDVFRGIDIEKFKIEHIPNSLEESYKIKTGKDIILTVAGAKKLQ